MHNVDANFNLKANIASPTFTGTPVAPTANTGTNTTQLATTAFVTTAVTTVENVKENDQKNSIAIGNEVANAGIPEHSVIIGYRACFYNGHQSSEKSVLIGSLAGNTPNAGDRENVAIGYGAMRYNCRIQNVAIGLESARDNGGAKSVSIGFQSAQKGNPDYTVAIGGMTLMYNFAKSTDSVFVGYQAGYGYGRLLDDVNDGTSIVSIGRGSTVCMKADEIIQTGAISIGGYCAINGLGEKMIAIGHQAGYNQMVTRYKGRYAVVIGGEAGNLKGVGESTIAIGYQAGLYGCDQATGPILIGHQAGGCGGNKIDTGISVGNHSIAIGYQAGNYLGMGLGCVAIGENAGGNSKLEDYSIAIGNRAGLNGLGTMTISMGKNSGLNNDAGYNVIIGHESQQNASKTGQSIWIGYYCGAYTSSDDDGSTVIGTYAAGSPDQPVGQYNTWLGYKVGYGLKKEMNRTIALNASNLPLLPTVENSFFVKPIRNAGKTQPTLDYKANGNGLFYNEDTGEVVYAGAKNFVIPHPEIKYQNQYLRHVCIEAPTRGTNIYEYQFTVETDNQKTKIELPSYFSLLNERPRVYVSAVNVFSHAYGDVNKERTHTIIHTEKAGTFNVLVTGVRKDPMAVQYSNGKSMMDEPIYFKDIPPNTRMNC